MADFEYHQGSALRRVIVCLGAVCVLLAMVYFVGLGAGVPFPMQAQAATRFENDWEFARETVDALNAQAIQICSAEATARGAVGTPNEAIRRAQVEVLTSEYISAERDYNARIRGLVSSGTTRPWDVPSKALPLDFARNKLCLRVAVAPPRAVRAVLATQQGVTVAPAYLHEPRFITIEQLDEFARLAGWPNEPGWWPDMRRIVLCETRSLDTMAHNTNDPAGGSYGLAQLNGSYHFANAGEDFAMRFDPVVNLRTALWLRTVRGHYGGGGGWANCSALWGID